MDPPGPGKARTAGTMTRGGWRPAPAHAQPSCVRFRFFHEAFHLNAIDGRLAIPIALEEYTLTVRGKNRGHLERIARAMLAQRQLAAGLSAHGRNGRRGPGWGCRPGPPRRAPAREK